MFRRQFAKNVVCLLYIYIYHVNKFEARLLFLYLPLKKKAQPQCERRPPAWMKDYEPR